MSTCAVASSLLPDHAVRLLRALPEAAMYLTAKGLILAANARACETLRLGAESTRDLRELVDDPTERLPVVLRTWSRSTSPTPGTFVTTIGSAKHAFNASGAVVLLPTDETPAILLVRFWPREQDNPFLLLNQKILQLNSEIARRIQGEEAVRRSEVVLRERADEAEALNRAKDEFLATVSHELRTPLTSILGWSWLLQSRTNDPEITRALEVIHRNAQSQAKLIDDILDVSRIITGKMRLETSPSDVGTLLRDAVEVIRPSAAAKEIDVTVAAPAEPCVIVADPDRLRQAFWNLLSNAVKFTDRGGSVSVELRHAGSFVRLTITDTGRGIEPEFLPFVFDRFKQADSTTTRRVGGLGLGLALVRHIVELHGGSVGVVSAGPGQGSTFEITLPLRGVTAVATAPPPRDLSRSEPRPSPMALQGLRVLVVDDEDDARALLATVLARAGGEVETADSAAAGFDAIARFRPHVLVSDVAMPMEDGLSFIQRLRRSGPDAGGATPACALTAYAREEDRAIALAAGFTAHIGKPVSPEGLISMVASLAALPPT